MTPQAPSIQGRLNRLVATVSILAAALLVSVLFLLISNNNHYATTLHNVTNASEFNREFKNDIDLKMYYYVIESRYSEGLPIEEVEDAQALARDLLSTTTQKDSHQAISSVLDLCQNLEEKIYQIQQTEDYDERQTQLENNVYVLTSLIQEYMYTYLYYEAAQLNAVQQQLEGQIIGEIIVVTLLAALLILWALRYSISLSHSITRPLTRLCRRAEDVSRGDLSPREPILTGAHEVRTLSVGMEEMIARLNQQMEAVRQQQESLRRTELALFQAQINPHFLYNTMDTIVWLIEAEKTQEAVQMVTDLSSFFRHALSKGEDVISLAQEEAHVRSYLQIQQARYKDILDYTIAIDPELHPLRLPKLTLQPLVENALYHGVKLKRARGRITVSGRREGDVVKLRVADNGVGIPPGRLEELRRAMSTGQRLGFGLDAVDQRLRLQFGPDFGLTLESTEGEGTVVTAAIPWPREEERK